MRKNFLLTKFVLLLLMLVGVGTTAWAEDADVTYDFTGSDWSVSSGTLTNGTVSFTGTGTNFKMNTGYFMLGKTNAYINFPTYSSPVAKIVITGTSGASESVKQNIFVNGTAVSTETTGAKNVSNEYVINSDYQTVGTTYTLKVTSSHNTQISKIEVFFAAVSANATSVTIDATGLTNTNVYTSTAAGSLSATVKDKNGNAIPDATVTWTSETQSVATIAADGTVTLVGEGSTKITASYAGLTGTYDASSATYDLTVTNIPTHTATFSVNGTTTSENFNEDAAIIFPANPTDIAGMQFVGWTTAAINGTQATAPTFVTSATMGTEDVTFYAVFAVATTSGVDSYEKLSSSSFDSSATYVIAGNQSSTDDTVYYLSSYENTDVDSSWGLATTTPETETPIKFKLSGTAAELVAKDNSGNYLTCYNVKKFGMSTTEAKVYLGEDGAIRVSSEGNYLRYNYNTGNGGFRWYASTTGTQAYFYKVFPGTTYSDYCTSVATTATITLNAACTDGSYVYGTYSNSRAFVVSDDIEVSEVGITNGTLNVQSYATGAVVPANTGVMVAALDGGDYTVQLSNETGTSVLGSDNRLRATGNGITAEEMAAADANCLYYRLTMHNGTQIGYWWGADGGAAFSVVANKAYLAVPNGLARMGFAFGSESTGISLTENGEQTDAPVFDLSGRRVNQPTKGLYIVNGKKMVVK